MPLFRKAGKAAATALAAAGAGLQTGPAVDPLLGDPDAHARGAGQYQGAPGWACERARTRALAKTGGAAAHSQPAAS